MACICDDEKNKRPNDNKVASDSPNVCKNKLCDIPDQNVPSIVSDYKFHRMIGHGAYGTVWAAVNRKTGQSVAIKKIGRRNFDQIMLTKRALRELKLLRHLSSNDNITALIDADVNTSDILKFNELYLVESLMEADLYQIIKSDQELTEQHCQYFTYQILKGIKWMHSANVVHRDLKPGNLLVNSDCHLRICDFGLGRSVIESPSNLYSNTEYVATRYYRAPEVILSPKNYSKEIDLWSIGCILAELINRKVIFKGSNYIDQLAKIFEVLGTPIDSNLMKNCSDKVHKLIKSWPRWQKVPLSTILPNSSDNAIDFLEKIFLLDPKKRMTAEKCLLHPYVSVYHNNFNEPSHPKKFNFDFESLNSVNDVKSAIINEVIKYKHELKFLETEKAQNNTHPNLFKISASNNEAHTFNTSSIRALSPSHKKSIYQLHNSNFDKNPSNDPQNTSITSRHDMSKEDPFTTISAFSVPLPSTVDEAIE